MDKQRLTEKELSLVKNMQDSRAVSSGLLNEFQNGGFKYLYELAKNDKALAICMRGNSGSIIIYYKNHVVLELSLIKGSCIASISFNHARYCNDYKEKFKKLQRHGFARGKKLYLKPYYGNDKSNNRYIKGIGLPTNGILKSYDVTSKEFANETIKIVKEIIDDYFDVNKTKDYFKEDWNKNNSDNQIEIKKRIKNPCVEKRWQQSLYSKMKNTQDGYFAYDMEFSQKFPNKDIRMKMEVNEPDMLAIRYEKKEPQAIVLIEVKSTRSACEGKCGIKKHLEGMNSYSKNPIFLQNRKSEAKQILEQYQKLGLISQEADVAIPDGSFELLLILTDNSIEEKKYTREMKKDKKYQSAIDYYINNQLCIDEYARVNNCKIRIINEKYWEEYKI